MRFGVLRRNTVHLPACGRESGLASAPRPWIGIGSSSKRQACDCPCPCLISSSVEYPHKSQYNLAEILSPSCHMLSFFLSFFLLEPEDQTSRCYSCSITVSPFYPRSSRMHVQVGTWKEHDNKLKKKAEILISSFLSLKLNQKKRKRKGKRDRKNIPPFGGCRSIDRSEKARDELASVFCRITTGFFPPALWKKVAEAKDRERIGCRPRRCSSLVYERIPCPHLIAEQHCNGRASARPCPESPDQPYRRRSRTQPQEADGRAEKQSNQPAIQFNPIQVT